MELNGVTETVTKTVSIIYVISRKVFPGNPKTSNTVKTAATLDVLSSVQAKSQWVPA